MKYDLTIHLTLIVIIIRRSFVLKNDTISSEKVQGIEKIGKKEGICFKE